MILLVNKFNMKKFFKSNKDNNCSILKITFIFELFCYYKLP